MVAQGGKQTHGLSDWGPKRSRYGGVDYPCRGVDILPHGVDFEVGWSRFVFPLAMGGVDFWEVNWENFKRGRALCEGNAEAKTNGDIYGHVFGTVYRYE